jgi:hypothetical protein
MAAIEPNWLSLIWFALFASVGGVALLVVAGMFPLSARADEAKSATTTLLVLGNVVLLAALLVGTGLYGYAHLRWTTLVVVSGLIFLFAPALIEDWPWRLRSAAAQLMVLVGVQALMLATLVKVGAAAILS